MGDGELSGWVRARAARSLLRRRAHDGRRQDLLRLGGTDRAVLTGLSGAVRDLLERLEAVDEHAERAVLAVEGGVGAVHDEELRRSRVPELLVFLGRAAAAARHRQDAAHVLLRVELVLDHARSVAGPPLR